MNIENAKELLNDIDTGKIKTLKQNSTFKFTCTMCGQCCFKRDVIINIYELVRMRNALGLTTSELFKKDFITVFTGSESGLPLCMISMDKLCPFLAPAYLAENIKIAKDLKKPTTNYICSINKHKPMMCRLYPLGRIIKMDKDSDKMSSKFVLLEEPVCKKAFENGKEWTLKEWLEDIEFKHYSEGSANFANLIKFIDDKGFNANAKTGKLKKDGSLLKIIKIMLYDFDLSPAMLNNKVVQKTLKDKNATHEDFMYVTELITNQVKSFIDFAGDKIEAGERVINRLINERP